MGKAARKLDTEEMNDDLGTLVEDPEASDMEPYGESNDDDTDATFDPEELKPTGTWTEPVTAVAVAGSKEVMATNTQAVADAFSDNLGDEGIDMRDFDRVKIPAGGSTTWTIPTSDGEQETKTFDGVILAHKMTRAFWSSEFSGGSSPPDCASDDCKTGHGAPGGNCANCQMNAFGTDKAGKGRGKACKEMRILFVLPEGEDVPLVLAVKPGSLANSKKYLLKLSLQKLRPHDVVTRMTLKKVKSADAIDYAEINFDVKERVKNAAEIASMAYIFKMLLAKSAASALVDQD